MNKALFLFAMMSLVLTACSDQNTAEQSVTGDQSATQSSAASDDFSEEEEFFELVEARLDTLEAMAEEDSVCMTRWMAVSDDDEGRLNELAVRLREKHGTDVPPQYQDRTDAIDARFEAVNRDLTPKLDQSC